MTDDSTSSSTPSFPKLSSSNYSIWKGEMKAFLCTKGPWTIVSGAEKRPDDSQSDLQAKWDLRADKAAGQLYLLLSAEQRTHIDAVQDHPVQIWSTLESIHLQQCPGACFNTWDDFFSIRKKQDKSLTSLIARIEDSMSKIQQLRPKDTSSPTWTMNLSVWPWCDPWAMNTPILRLLSSCSSPWRRTGSRKPS